MWETGHVETAHRVRTLCGQVFRYAVATGRADSDIAADLRKDLPGLRIAQNVEPDSLG